MTRRFALSLCFMLELVLVVALIVGITTSPQETFAEQVEPGIAPTSECRGFGGNEGNVDLAWRSTVAVEDYTSYFTVTSRYIEELFGRVTTPYTFYLNQIEKKRLSDISLNWTGDGNCEQESNNDILCTGNVEDLSISYNCYFTPTYQGSDILFHFSPLSDESIEYGFHFFYLPRFLFMSTTLTPTWYPEPDIGDYRLYWHQANMQNFEAQVTFRDLGIIFLPVVVKNR